MKHTDAAKQTMDKGTKSKGSAVSHTKAASDTMSKEAQSDVDKDCWK